MAIWETIKHWFGTQGGEVYDYDTGYDTKFIGNLTIPERLSDSNCFTLANSVSEIFFPVDFYADRLSKLRYYIADLKDKELVNSELKRFVGDDINPLFSFSDLIYQYVFSLLADGNAISYLGIPKDYTTVSPASIERWDVLQPNMVEIQEYNNVSMLNIKSWNELIKRVKYDEVGYKGQDLNLNNLVIQNYSNRRKSNSLVLARSPLYAANKSIDVLLAVYSARYNVYANNGAAGYLAKKTGKTETYEEMILDGNKRDDILRDINDRNGITGRRNIWGISGVPIEFVKTLATINELMPLEETLENAIKIASVFQIPPPLVPRSDRSTLFASSDLDTAEQTVWENGLLSMAETVCQNLTKMFRLSNAKIMFDTSNVSALMANEVEDQDLIAKKLTNLEKIKTLSPETDITLEVNEIFKEYGT